jgi:putative flippase GtrA
MVSVRALGSTHMALWREVPRSLRYTIVGGLCAVINNLLLIGVVTLGLGYLAGIFAVCAPMLVIGYSLHALVTFEKPLSLVDFLRFSIGNLASYPMWIASHVVLCSVLALPIYVATPIATLILFCANYLLAHWAYLRSTRAAFDLRARPGDENSL